MNVSTKQQALLATTLDALTTYVNQRFSVVRDEEGLDYEERAARTQLIDRFLWEHTELIDEFVRENPAHLTKEHLSVAKDLTNTFYGQLLVERCGDGKALALHETGAYHVVFPLDSPLAKLPYEPLSLRGALAPLGDSIVAIPPFVVTGPSSHAEMDAVRAKLERSNTSSPVSDARIFTRRVQAWRARQAAWECQQSTAAAHAPQEVPGFHRGALAGLSGAAREAALKERRDQVLSTPGCLSTILDLRSVDAPHFPLTLAEGLELLDDDWLLDIASQLNGATTPPPLDRKQLVDLICTNVDQSTEHPEEALTWCLDQQFQLLQRIMDTNPLPLSTLPPHVAAELYPLVPYVFILHDGSDYVAWMPPEVRSLVARIDLGAVEHTRSQLARAEATGRILATMCGIITVADAYERYRQATADPLDRWAFKTALTELESCTYRDDYALWRHGGVDYLVSVELSDASALARVARESYQDHLMQPCDTPGLPETPLLLELTDSDEQEFVQRIARKQQMLEEERLELLRMQGTRAPHDLSPQLLAARPIQALTELEALRRLREFVDGHIPDQQDDYEFADTFVRSVVVSAVLMRESYDQTISLIQLYGMQGCEGTTFSDTLGRLVTNAYNALPRWNLCGWSLEENTERITGRRRFYHDDGRMRIIGDHDPCPCGSGKQYGSCCGNLP